MSITNEPVAPAAPVPPVANITMTSAQLSALLAGVPMKTVAVADAKVIGTDALAALKQIVSDAEGTVTKTHGAAKALQADIKANWGLLLALGLGGGSMLIHLWPYLVKVL